MNKIIFSGLMILVCCLVSRVGVVNAEVDLGGQCIDISIPAGTPSPTGSDICRAAGFYGCINAGGGGGYRQYLSVGCGGMWSGGITITCGSTNMPSQPNNYNSVIVPILICNDIRGWGIISQPSNVPDDFEQSIKNATDWILGFVAMIAVLMLIWGGISYLTSAGDEDKARMGKKTIQYALIGMVVAGIAYAIVDVIITVIL